MLARLFGSTTRGITRSLTTSPKLLQFENPSQLIERKKQEKLENEQFDSTLLDKSFDYNPQYIPKNEVVAETQRPLPLNVELLKYKPITLPQTHGHEVAKIKLRSYNQDNLIRAGEFALRSAYYLGIPTSKFVSEKTEKRLYTVIRSPFAQAKSKENFHRVTYNGSLTAFDANPEVVDLWLSYINKYTLTDVDYSATLTTRESLDYAEKLDQLTLEDFKLPEAYADTTDPVADKVKELLKSDTFKDLIKK